MNSIVARASSTAAPKLSIDDLLSDVTPQRARIIFAIDARVHASRLGTRPL